MDIQELACHGTRFMQGIAMQSCDNDKHTMLKWAMNLLRVVSGCSAMLMRDLREDDKWARKSGPRTDYAVKSIKMDAI